jgi:predicted nucleic acid-binding protein
VPLVLDASIAAAWCFPDEASAYAETVLDQLRTTNALVPAIWPLELANILVVGERRQRIQPAETARFVELLQPLPITVDADSPDRALGSVLGLARDYQLSAYDAAYLDLAVRHGLPLATLDRQLRAAAVAAGVALVEEP